MKKLLMGVGALSLMATSSLAGSPSTVEIEVTGDRECVCNAVGTTSTAVSGLSTLTVPFGPLSEFGDATEVELTGLGLYCNTPFDFSVTSANGYLALQTSSSPSAYDANDETTSDFTSAATSDFVSGVDYTVAVSGGSLSSIVASTAILDGGVPQSAAALPPQNISGISLTFDTIPEMLPLIGGSYMDVLTINITPVPV